MIRRSFIAALLFGAVISVGCTRIEPGYVGIKVVAGGSDRGVQDFPAQVGWVFYNPLTTNVLEYPTFVQPAVWTANTQEGKPINEEITFSNRDNMLVAADVNAAYHIEANKVPQFYVQFRSDNLDNFTHGFFKNAVRDAFNTHAGKYDISQIMGDNATFLHDVRQSVEEQVSQYGVKLDQFGIIGIPRPPQAVIDAINAKVHATQLAQQKQNELIQVQADMAKEREKTDTYARNTRAMADAQAEANEKLARSLSPSLVQYKALEKWNGVLPTITGSGAVPFINVDHK